jgi:hypothetical protein
MKFKALKTFTSREFQGSQYVEGLTYTIREGNAKLAEMAQKWLDAKRFVPKEDFTIMGIDFKSGKETYFLQGDELEIIINAKVAEGKAEYTGTGLITFDFIDNTAGSIDGSVAKQIGA